MKKHFIETVGPYPFRFKGALGSEHKEIEVKDRNIQFIIPDKVYGFRFFDREETVVGSQKIYGPKTDISPWTYVGKIFTRNELAEKYSEEKILLDNVEANQWDRMLLSPFGNWIPLEPDDKVVTSTIGF